MTDRDRGGRTPLHYAVIDGPSDMEFLTSTDPEAKAQKLEDFVVSNTRKLLDQGGVDVNARDDEGFTPLHFASQRESAEVVRLVLDAGADVNIVSNNGTTPIYNAIRNTSPAGAQIVRLLLEKGADPTIEMPNGSSALKLAKRMQPPEVMKALADHGYE